MDWTRVVRNHFSHVEDMAIHVHHSTLVMPRHAMYKYNLGKVEASAKQSVSCDSKCMCPAMCS